MHTHHTPLLFAGKYILPLHRRLPAAQDILAHARAAPAAQYHGPPLALTRDLELHAAADRLRDAERPAQRLHAHGLLRELPLLEARLEGVRRGRGGGVLGRREGVRAQAGAEGVV